MVLPTVVDLGPELAELRLPGGFSVLSRQRTLAPATGHSRCASTGCPAATTGCPAADSAATAASTAPGPRLNTGRLPRKRVFASMGNDIFTTEALIESPQQNTES